MADPEFLKGVVVHSCVRSVRKILEATPTLGRNHAHFDRFLRLLAVPVQSINFRINFLLKHSKVSHSSSFLSSIARKGGGGFLLVYHQYFLVLDAAQRGVHLHPPYPLGSTTDYRLMAEINVLYHASRTLTHFSHLQRSRR